MILKTRDHPEANGRKPLPTETQYILTFPLETGETLKLKMGQEGFDLLTQFLFDILENRPSYSDEK